MKTLKYIFALLALPGIFSGCLKDAPEGGGDGRILLELTMPALASGTRAGESIAATPAFEYVVDHIDVLVFEDRGGWNDVFSYVTVPLDPEITHSGNPRTRTYVLPLERTAAGKKHKLVVLANLEDQVAELLPTITAGMTKQDILSRLTFDYPSPDWDMVYGGLPMWGESPNSIAVTVNTQGGAFGIIRMVYSVAKIEVAVGADSGYTEAQGLDGFKMCYVRAYNPLNKGYATPQPASSLTDGVVKQPAIPSDAGTDLPYGAGEPAFDNINYDNFGIQPNSPYLYRGPLYVMEADNRTADNDSRMFVVIGGYYTSPGAPENTSVKSYYRIDFHETANLDAVESIDILRSHRYMINITGVDGPGYPTEEEAAASLSSRMHTTIAVWNQKGLVTILEGTEPEYVFEVERYYSEDPQSAAYWTFDGGARNELTDDNWLTIRTDHEAGWYSWSVNVEEDGTETPMYQQTGDSWLWLFPEDGAGFMGGELAGIHVEPYDSAIPRRGRIYIKAGEYIFTIEVEQKKEITVSPSSRLFSFMSHRNGPMSHNTFTIDAGVHNWTLGEIEFEGTPWGLEVLPVEGTDNQFYLQSDAHTGNWQRKAVIPVRIDLGDGTFKTIRVPVTQDWTDCGVGGWSKPAVFDTSPGALQPTVQTHLVGGNLMELWTRGSGYEGAIDWIEYVIQGAENIDDARREIAYLIPYPNVDYYSCWMVENSHYGTPELDVHQEEAVGPYYTPSNAASACPPGWRLPNYDDMALAWGMQYAASLPDDVIRDQIAGVRAFIASPDTFMGYCDYYTRDIENRDTHCYLLSHWDGWISEDRARRWVRQYPDYFPPEVIEDYARAVYSLDGNDNNNYYSVLGFEKYDDSVLGIGSASISSVKNDNQWMPVRCVKDVIYQYE